MKNEFEDLSIDETFQKLDSSKDGLSEYEAKKRLSKYGFNEITEKKQSNIIKFLKKFWAPVPWMLEFTIILTYVLGKYLDMYIILFLLVFNSIVSFVQESKAQDAIELLKHKVSVNARALRDKEWQMIAARFLVPGDIVHVRMGDITPGDMKLIDGEVESDQSMLTGESLPVRVKEGNVLYSSSIIKRGEATGIIVYTGKNTLFGKTTELVQTAGSKSHLESLIMNIVKYLVVMDVALIAALIIFSLLTHVSISDVIPFSLVVLIASVPVALPATFTMAMAIGALDLSKKGVLVTRLTAVEDAASMDTLCLDKTGTITKNQLSVDRPIPVDGDESELIRYAMIASDASTQDSIDLAILKYGKEKNYDASQMKRIKFTPFDPAIKRTEAVIEENGKNVTIMKGAPQVLLGMCNPDKSEVIMESIRDLAIRGFRTIAVAKCVDEKKDFIGIIPLYDPPRGDSKKFIEKLKAAGISPKMITGDSESIAEEISKEVGIGDRACKISSIKKDESSIGKCDSIAEVFPEDKYDVVRILQKENHVTGMTGDGVNDAPALKQAEVGIAVSSATDVAKASASVVLTHEGLTDIVSAVEDGRRIYQRMLTYTLNKIIKTIQVAIFLT
ncbi:MAG: plasma-membrane proton-efflux P-type ATPase, partial [Thermoplasmata archaeon]